MKIQYISIDGVPFDSAEACEAHETAFKNSNKYDSKIKSDTENKKSKKPQWMETARFKNIVNRWLLSGDIQEKLDDDIEAFAEDLGISTNIFYDFIVEEANSMRIDNDDSDEVPLDEDACLVCDDVTCPEHPEYECDEDKAIFLDDFIESLVDFVLGYFGEIDSEEL